MKLEVNSKRWLDLKRLPGESWRVIHDSEEYGTYLISNYGRLKRMPFFGGRYHFPEMIFKVHLSRKGGYYKCRVANKMCYIHQLVARAFVKKGALARNTVDHRNGNKLDNRARNLRWVTPEQNANNPVTVWQQRVRNGMAGPEDKPNPGRTQKFLPPEKCRMVV